MCLHLASTPGIWPSICVFKVPPMARQTKLRVARQSRWPSSPSDLASSKFLSLSLITASPISSTRISQFTAAAFTGVLIKKAIAISMDGRGAWRDDLFVEQLWRSVKYEEVYLKDYDSVSEQRTSLDSFCGRTGGTGGTPQDLVRAGGTDRWDRWDQCGVRWDRMRKAILAAACRTDRAIFHGGTTGSTVRSHQKSAEPPEVPPVTPVLPGNTASLTRERKTDLSNSRRVCESGDWVTRYDRAAW
jgi:transposase InsO family protein